MLMPPFELHHPATVEEACALAATLMEQGQSFDWVAGGTDVLPNYKWHINTKNHVISLANIGEMKTISNNKVSGPKESAELLDKCSTKGVSVKYSPYATEKTYVEIIEFLKRI